MSRKLPILLAVVGLLAACGASEEDCAKGTELKNGVCVAAAGSGDPTSPRAKGINVRYFAIEEEGQRPLYLMHPMNVSVSLELEAEPFKTDMVVGFSSADGTKHCAAGYLEFTFDSAPEGAENSDQPNAMRKGQISVNETVFVQPRCKNLIGEKKAKVWLAIDPFHRLDIGGDLRPGSDNNPSDDASIDAWLYKSRWPLDGCRSSFSSGHAKNCKSTVEVADTPGLDLRLRYLVPSSSVVIARKGKQRDADVFANTTIVLYGQESKEGDKTLEEANVRFHFMLRPDVEYTDLPPGVTPGAVDWQRLDRIEKVLVKGQPPLIKDARLSFLASLSNATRTMTDSALMFPPVLRYSLTQGAWSKFGKFQLLGCARSALPEAVAKGLGLNNNCKTTSLVITRHELPAKGPLGGHHTEYEVEWDDQVFEYEWAADPKDKVNRCKDVTELRPKCIFLGQHKDETPCYAIPDYKVDAIDGPNDEVCHCCYPPNAFDPSMAFRFDPELAFTLGSDESIGLRSSIWWDLFLEKKSMFEPQPTRMRTTAGFDISLVGWWRRSLLFIDMPIQLGIMPGVQSYWWPELGVLGFTLWDEKYTIEDDEPAFQIPALAAKEWTQNFCQTFCVQIVCFDVCAQIGASVALKAAMTVEEKDKKIVGSIGPEVAGIAGGSAGLNLFLGVIGVEIVFDKFIAFGSPFKLAAQFVIEQLSDPMKVRINATASYDLEMDVLKGFIGGFWKPKWGGQKSIELYDWDGLKYTWELWKAEWSWLIEL